MTAAFAVLQPRSAAAHGRSVSYSAWAFDGATATVRLRTSLVDLGALERFKSDEVGLAAYLRRSLTLASSERACVSDPNSFRRLSAEVGWMAYEWRVTCATAPTALTSDLLLDEKPMHVHIASFSSPASAPARVGEARAGESPAPFTVERVLNDGARTVAVPKAPGTWLQALTEKVPIGFTHILSGPDHLMFLLVLVLLGSRLRWLLGVVTGFTLGHSVTLGLATLGYATPAVTTVEALVGLSIALVAVENVWLVEPGAKARSPRIPATFVAALVVVMALSMLGVVQLPTVMLFGIVLFAACYFAWVARHRQAADGAGNLRWAVAALFGLVHGFAFAEVLHGAELPASRLVPALLGFNIGVEAGQVAVLLVAWPALRWVRARGAEAQAVCVRYGSAVAVCAGVYWFVSRGF